MSSIFDSLITLLSSRLLEVDIPCLKEIHHQPALKLESAFQDLLCEKIDAARRKLTNFYTRTKRLDGLSRNEALAITCLGLGITNILKRQYAEAARWIKYLPPANDDLSESSSELLIPTVQASTILSLYWNRYPELKPSLKKLLQLVATVRTRRASSYAISALATLVRISSQTALASSARWLSVAEDALSTAKIRFAQDECPNLLQSAVLLQCSASLHGRKKQFAEAESALKEALNLVNTTGYTHAYRTELFLDLGQLYYEARRLEEAESACRNAITCEVAGARDSLRLARVYDTLGRVHHASKLDSQEVLDTLRAALTLYRAASEFHVYDMLSVLHVMRWRAESAGLVDELKEIRTEVERLNHQLRHCRREPPPPAW